nr:hypothetical protein [Xanthomonas populi]
MKRTPWTFLALATISCVASAADKSVYIEFLWDAQPSHSIARQQTIQFLTDSKHDHQVCVATDLADTDVRGLVLTVLDASGQEVSSHKYPDYRGVKHCYSADLGKEGTPGLWTFRAKTGDGRAGESTIQVHARLEDSPLSKDPGTEVSPRFSAHDHLVVDVFGQCA